MEDRKDSSSGLVAEGLNVLLSDWHYVDLADNEMSEKTESKTSAVKISKNISSYLILTNIGEQKSYVFRIFLKKIAWNH